MWPERPCKVIDMVTISESRKCILPGMRSCFPLLLRNVWKHFWEKFQSHGSTFLRQILKLPKKDAECNAVVKGCLLVKRKLHNRPTKNVSWSTFIRLRIQKPCERNHRNRYVFDGYIMVYE